MDERMYYMILEYIPHILLVVISLPVHEFAHGFIANKLGDDTAYYQGRLSLNPLRHLDILGTISMILFGYGWAKPVPVNPTRFKCNMRLGMALTALAGPVSNLLLALLFTILYKVALILYTATAVEFFLFLASIISSLVFGNIALAFFNLLPIPPLDGSRILNYFLPYRAQAFIDNLERYSFIILAGILMLDNRIGFLSNILGYLVNFFYFIFDKMTFFLDFLF